MNHIIHASDLIPCELYYLPMFPAPQLLEDESESESFSELELRANDDLPPHVQCPTEQDNFSNKRSSHSLIDLFGLRSFYAQICRECALPQLYVYPEIEINPDSDPEETKTPPSK